jgi:Thioredoxin-like
MTQVNTSIPTLTSSTISQHGTTSVPTLEKPVPRNKAKVRPPPGANGQVIVKNTPPPGLDNPTEKKGPRIRIIDWGANRRTNTTIQSMTQPNFKPGVPGATTHEEPVKVKRNYVIPKNVQKPPGAGATTAVTKGGHKRRPIPDISISPAGEETLWEQLLGPKLIANSKLQKKNTIACMKDQELIGLYFGCAMKSDCKVFHPRLQDFYFSTTAGQQNMEIVYISSDRSMMEFKELFAKMPYLALPGGGTACYKNKLSQSFKIIDQPTLVILDDEGMVVTVDAVNQIMSLERGNIDQASALVDRWKKTRPVSIDDIQRDFALQYGKLQRGVLYWQE